PDEGAALFVREQAVAGFAAFDCRVLVNPQLCPRREGLADDRDIAALQHDYQGEGALAAPFIPERRGDRTVGGAACRRFAFGDPFVGLEFLVGGGRCRRRRPGGTGEEDRRRRGSRGEPAPAAASVRA